MSFSYNNRMPYYAWGKADNNYSTNDTDDLNYFGVIEDENKRNLSLLRSTIPTAEYGPPKVAKAVSGFGYNPGESTYETLYESSPVDRQIPWRKIVARRDFWLGELNGLGLTMFGELYGIRAFAPRIYQAENGFVNIKRRVFRIRSPLARRCFQWIGESSGSGPFGFANPCISSKYGEVFLYYAGSRRAYVAGAAEDEHLIPIPIPDGERASRFWVIDGSYDSTSVFVLATESGKTFVRGVGATGSFWGNTTPAYLSEWTLLTSGVVNAVIRSTGNARFPDSSAPPSIIVSEPPPAGAGEIPAQRARISCEWYYDTSSSTWELYQIFIVHPGSGYRSPPTISFSPAPFSGTPARIDLELFDATIESRMQDGNFRSGFLSPKVGEAYYFTVPPTSFTRPPSWPGRTSGDPADAGLRVATSYSYRTGVSSPISAANGPFGWAANSSSGYFYSTIGGVADSLQSYDTEQHVLTTSGKLYRITSNGPQLVPGGEWVSIARSHGTFAAVNKDGGLYTWGATPSLYGDGTTTVRNSPVRIAPEAEWVDCVGGWGNRPLFIAIRKDATCRGIDEPMPLWPDSYFEQ